MMTKKTYNIEINEGCPTGYYINNKDLMDTPKEEIVAIINKLMETSNKDDLDEILVELVESQGEYKCSDEPCETCGEYHEEWSLTVEVP